MVVCFFFFQAEDGIRDADVTGVQTCALPIFTAIVARLPTQGANILRSKGWPLFTVVCLLGLLVVVAVIFVEQAQRRIPVQYAKRQVGRRMYGGSSTYIPLKVNQAGVIPIIFASSLLYLPTLLASIVNKPWVTDLNTRLDRK